MFLSSNFVFVENTFCDRSIFSSKIFWLSVSISFFSEERPEFSSPSVSSFNNVFSFWKFAGIGMSEWEINNPEFRGHFEYFMLFVMGYRNNTEFDPSIFSYRSIVQDHDEYIRNHNFWIPLNPQANVTTYSAESDVVTSEIVNIPWAWPHFQFIVDALPIRSTP